MATDKRITIERPLWEGLGGGPLRVIPTVFSQPRISSTRFRISWLTW